MVPRCYYKVTWLRGSESRISPSELGTNSLQKLTATFLKAGTKTRTILVFTTYVVENKFYELVDN